MRDGEKIINIHHSSQPTAWLSAAEIKYMAEIGIIETFKARHGQDAHEHNFRVEVILEGEVDSESGYAGGIDHYDVILDIKKIISTIDNKNLKEILNGLGFKSSGNESIATFFLNKLTNKYPVKCVKIWETDERYATVYSKE